jgi:hypothetical protein
MFEAKDKTKQINPDWLEQEALQTEQQSNYPQLPSIRFEENKIMEITIDFSEKFPEWNTTGLTGKPTTKAIIPIEHEGIKKVWWLNKQNPLYRDVIRMGREGITKFKILQTGTQQNTRYVIIK